MKTILVLSSHPDFAEVIRAALAPEQFRIVHRTNVEDCEPLMVHGLASVCILDADLMGVENVWVIERLRRRDTKTPLVRMVFPIFDRHHYHRYPTWGYDGALRVLVTLLDEFFEALDANTSDIGKTDYSFDIIR